MQHSASLDVEKGSRSHEDVFVINKSKGILIVDDDPVICQLVAAILKDAGFYVLEARDGVEALMRIDAFSKHINVLLVDVDMPRMSGSELACVVFAHHPEIKFIFMSGQPDHVVDRHGISTSKLRFIKKPFTPEVLLHAVREELNNSYSPLSLSIPYYHK